MKSALLIIAVALSALAIDNKCIVYAFAGHSNMKFFLEKGGEKTFLETMTALYPGYRFKSIRGGYLSTLVNEFDKGDLHYDRFISDIKAARDTFVIGGAGLMYGFVEGRSEKEANLLQENMTRLISDIRLAAENADLPVFINRYDLNCAAGEAQAYRKFYQTIDSEINRLPEPMSHIYLYPVRYMPEQRYLINDHHYDSIGHWICGIQIPVLIQINNEDFWFRR